MAKITIPSDFSKSAPMLNDCIELIQLLARPDGICILPHPLMFQPQYLQYSSFVYAAQVSPKGEIYVHSCFNDETPELNNQEQWWKLDMNHYADRLILNSLYICLIEMADGARELTDILLSELHIEKEECHG